MSDNKPREIHSPLIVTKVCGTCKQDKLLKEFDNQKNGKYEKRGSCKKCKSIIHKKWRDRNPGVMALNAKKWRINNPEKYKEKMRRESGSPSTKKAQKKYYDNNKEKRHLNTKKWRDENPDKLAIINRRNQLKRLYGITLEKYNEMLIDQNNKCLICETDKPKGRGDFHVDHNHKTGEVRGLLCHYCNIALGLSKENIDILKKSIKYLEYHNEKNK